MLYGELLYLCADGLSLTVLATVAYVDAAGKALSKPDSEQSPTVSFKLTDQTEECLNKAPSEPTEKEDEATVHQRQVAEETEVTSAELCSPYVKEEEPSGTMSNKQDNQKTDEVIEISESESKTLLEAAEETTQDKDQDSGKDIRFQETPETKNTTVGRQETLHSNSEAKVDVKATSHALEHEVTVKSYFETSSKEDSSQSYYELSRSTELKLCDVKQEHEGHKESLEQKGMSLNIMAGSTAEQGQTSVTFTESLCPGSVDEFATHPPLPFVHSHPPTLPPALSVTPTSTDSSEDITTKAERASSSVTHSPMLQQSDSFSEMLDLAGALPWPSLEKRELEHIRRKSVPANVSSLVGSSLAELALGEPRTVGKENQLEDLGYCIFSEYSGPMPSPADLPSPGDSPHQQFPSVEGEAEEDTGVTEVDEKVLQPEQKEVLPEVSQKPLLEKKDSPVKTSLMLEKAVPSGMKPDRLRIPLTPSKDRLTEFRLEGSLPGDIKIQPIPEVDIEKDPSREASPIPPDNSFTFSPAETGCRSPRTPTTPKTPNDTRSGPESTEIARSDILPHFEQENPEPEKTEEEVNKTENAGVPCQLPEGKEMASHPATVGLKQLETQDCPEDGCNKLEKVPLENRPTHGPSTSPVIIIPQATQIEDPEEDDIEIAEEPPEIMEEVEDAAMMSQAEEKEDRQKTVTLLVGDQVPEDDPRSGAEEWSHSGINSDEGEQATDSSHLSPCSDPDLPQQLDKGGKSGETEQADDTEDLQKIKEGQAIEKTVLVETDVATEQTMESNQDIAQQVEDTSDQAPEDETTVDASILDTESGWIDSQGTQPIIYMFTLSKVLRQE